MAKTPSIDQIKTQAVKPLFAAAGATELAVDIARGVATDAQKNAQGRIESVSARVSGVDRDPKALQAKAVALLNARVEEITKDAKDAQTKFEARVAEIQKEAREFPTQLQKQLNEALTELTGQYAELAERGEKFVAAIRKDGVKAVTSKPAAAKKAPAPAPVKKAVAKKAPAKKAVKKAPAK